MKKSMYAPVLFSSDIPVPADYTGDGKVDYAIFRPATGTWWVKGITNVVFGQAGDIPCLGDYNGYGKTDYAYYRPSTNAFAIRNGATVTFVSGYKPVTLPYHMQKFFFP